MLPVSVGTHCGWINHITIAGDLQPSMPVWAGPIVGSGKGVQAGHSGSGADGWEGARQGTRSECKTEGQAGVPGVGV